MGRLSRSLVMAVALSFAAVAAASAADLCFKDEFNQVLVGKALTLPTANNCKPFSGYINNTYSLLNGNVCKAHDNKIYVFNIHFTLQANDGGTVVFYLDSTNGFTGEGNWLNWDLGGGGFADHFTITKITCPTIRKFGPPA